LSFFRLLGRPASLCHIGGEALPASVRLGRRMRLVAHHRDLHNVSTAQVRVLQISLRTFKPMNEDAVRRPKRFYVEGRDRQKRMEE